MSANTSPIFGKNVKSWAVTFVNADGTTPKTLITAGTEGCRVLGINVVTDDSSNETIQLYLQLLGIGSNYLIGGKLVTALSGTGASPLTSIGVLDPAQIGSLQADGSLLLAGTDVLKVAPVAAVTSAKTTTIIAWSSDY